MVELRRATREDATGVRRVARVTYRAVYTDVVGADGVDRMLSEWYDPDSLRDRLADDDARTVVAVDHSPPGAADASAAGVVGYASAFVEADSRTGHLGTLYVHPDRWGEGIGTRLFERARDHVADRGGERMRIRVFADNDVGRSFYEDRARLVAETADHVDPLDRDVPVAVYETGVG